MIKDVTEVLGSEGREGLVRRIDAQTREIPINESNATENKLPNIKTLSQLVGENLKLPDALIEGVLHKGSTMVFGGGSKTNKTFGLMDLALSVAAGVPWWNMKRAKGRVLYLDFELQPAFFAKRAEEICKAKNLPMSVLEDVDVWNLRGFAADLSEQIHEILDRIKDKTYALIIVDPIYKALGKRDENCAGDINSLMNEVDKLAVKSGAGVVIGHHFSKGNQSSKQSMDRISGSGVFGRAPDAIVILTAHEEDGVYTVESTLRNFKRLKPFCLEWIYPLMERNDKVDPAKLKKAGAQGKFSKEQLLSVLGNNEMTTKEWETQTCTMHGMSVRTFAVKKKNLLDLGKIVTTENGKWKKAERSDPQAQQNVTVEGSDE